MYAVTSVYRQYIQLRSYIPALSPYNCHLFTQSLCLKNEHDDNPHLRSLLCFLLCVFMPAAQLACLSKQPPTVKNITPSKHTTPYKSNVPSSTEKNNIRQRSVTIAPHRAVSSSPQLRPNQQSPPSHTSRVQPSDITSRTGLELIAEQDIARESTWSDVMTNDVMEAVSDDVMIDHVKNGTTNDTVEVNTRPVGTGSGDEAVVDGNDDDIDDDNSDDSTPPPPPPRPATLIPNKPTSTTNTDPIVNNEGDEVGISTDRRDSVDSMLTPPSPARSQLPSPSRSPTRNNNSNSHNNNNNNNNNRHYSLNSQHNHHGHNPDRRYQQTSTRPSTTPPSSSTIPPRTTSPHHQTQSNGNHSNRIVNRSSSSASAGGGLASSDTNRTSGTSSTGSYPRTSGAGSGSSNNKTNAVSSSGNSSSSSSSSSRLLGPTFSDLMRRSVSPTYPSTLCTLPVVPYMHPSFPPSSPTTPKYIIHACFLISTDISLPQSYSLSLVFCFCDCLLLFVSSYFDDQQSHP